MFPRGLGPFIGMPVVGVLVSRFDPRKLLVLGSIGAGFSLFQLPWLNLSSGYWDIFWPQISDDSPQDVPERAGRVTATGAE